MAGDFMEDLNSNQHDAVYAEGDCLISACPGSGKTRVLSQRAAWLIGQKKARVAAVTFTRDAATELEHRVRKMLPNGIPVNRFLVGTFHSLALQQLKELKLIDTKHLLNNGDWDLLVRQSVAMAMKEGASFGTDPIEQAKRAIQAFQARMSEPPPATIEHPDALVFANFTRLKQSAGKFDFSDIMHFAIRGMRDGTINPLDVDYMLVDEAQDMDEVQYAWIAQHSGPGSKQRGCLVTLVGDDDQSIYGWRWAMGYAGMMRFMTEHGASHVVLPVNYRCAPEILEPAARLIRYNINRVDKPIRAAKPPGGRVRVMPVSDREIEADEVIKMAIDLHPEETMAVIARTNKGLDIVESRLAFRGINYIRIGGGSFLDDQAVNALINVLYAIIKNTPKEITGHLHLALSWIGVPGDVVERAVVHAGGGANTFLEYILTHETEHLTEKAQHIVTTLAALLPGWSKLVRKDRTALLINSVVTWLKFEASKRDGRMIDVAGKILVRLTGTLSQRLAKIKNLGRKKQDEQPPSDDRALVTLLTMHASKGLEFDKVWVIGAEDGVIPHCDAPIDEERRLFYVAMTRAKKDLVVSFESGKQRSPFLKESGIN
jgi:superfamily I DNA/RNA helicase